MLKTRITQSTQATCVGFCHRLGSSFRLFGQNYWVLQAKSWLVSVHLREWRIRYCKWSFGRMASRGSWHTLCRKFSDFVRLIRITCETNDKIWQGPAPSLHYDGMVLFRPAFRPVALHMSVISLQRMSPMRLPKCKVQHPASNKFHAITWKSWWKKEVKNATNRNCSS